MQRLAFTRALVAGFLAVGGLAATSAAHARSDVSFSIGIGAPVGHVYPAPVYVQPQPVYVQPRPVFVQPQPVYVQPQPVYGHGYQQHHHRRGPWGDRDGDGVPNRYDRHPGYDDRGYGHGHGGGRDADRDGVPNRYDRAPHNPNWR